MPESAALIDAVRALMLASRVVNPAVGELSPADYRLLSTIGSGEERASRLASRLSLGRPTISASIDSLSKRGLVLRSSVQGDSRATALSLSEEGATLLALVESRMSRQLELLCERTPNGERVIESLNWLGTVIEAAFADRLARADRLAGSADQPATDQPATNQPATDQAEPDQ